MKRGHKKVIKRLFIPIVASIIMLFWALMVIAFYPQAGAAILVMLPAPGIALFFLLRYIRNIILDLSKPPEEIEGFVADKWTRRHISEGGSNNYSYHLRIDTLGFGLECYENEWDMVMRGNKVRVAYHPHTKLTEGITLIDKGTATETAKHQQAWEKVNGHCQCFKAHHGHDIPCNKELKQDAYMQKVEGGWVYCDLYDFSSKDIDAPGIVCWDCYNWRIDFNWDKVQSRSMT